MYNVGILFLFLYNLITSVKSVYVGSLLQHINPLIVLSISFLIVTVFFNIMLATKHLHTKTWQTVIKAKKECFLLSLSTLVGWVGFYFALKLIEPAIVTGITSAVGPILTRVFFFNETKTPNGSDKYDSLFGTLIFIVMAYLVWQTLIGKSSIGAITLNQAILGFTFAMLCGAANVTNTIFSKRLNGFGFGSIQILSFRFIPLIIGSAITLLIQDTSSNLSSADFTKITAIALLGITLPIYLFQEGIKKSPAQIVAYVHATIPVFVLLIQFFDPRLIVTTYSIGGIICISSISLLSILIKNKPLLNKI